MIETPSTSETSAFADWAELACLINDYDSIAKSEIEDALEAAQIEEVEDLVSDIWQQIDGRHRLASDFHPIEVQPTRLIRKKQWQSAYTYTFQLLISSHKLYSNTKINRLQWKKVAKLFERFATSAIEGYLPGEAINVGFPREGEVPKGFTNCLDYLCQRTGELRGPIKSYNLPTKDDKVDIIAWLPFPDMRTGQVMIFAQCAAGSDWKSKAGEISLELWKDYINWAAMPIMAIAFPFVCIDSGEWGHLSKQNRGFLLDRLRLSSIYRDRRGATTDLRKEIKNWCKRQIASVPRLN